MNKLTSRRGEKGLIIISDYSKEITVPLASSLLLNKEICHMLFISAFGNLVISLKILNYLTSIPYAK